MQRCRIAVYAKWRQPPAGNELFCPRSRATRPCARRTKVDHSRIRVLQSRPHSEPRSPKTADQGIRATIPIQGCPVRRGVHMLEISRRGGILLFDWTDRSRRRLDGCDAAPLESNDDLHGRAAWTCQEPSTLSSNALRPGIQRTGSGVRRERRAIHPEGCPNSGRGDVRSSPLARVPTWGRRVAPAAWWPVALRLRGLRTVGRREPDRPTETQEWVASK